MTRNLFIACLATLAAACHPAEPVSASGMGVAPASSPEAGSVAATPHSAPTEVTSPDGVEFSWTPPEAPAARAERAKPAAQPHLSSTHARGRLFVLPTKRER